MMFKKPYEIRVLRALKMKQDLLCLEHQGFVIVDNEKLDREGWRGHMRRQVTYRMRLKDRPYNRGNNADRAADILRKGPESRWWFARNSNSPSGDDRRGIKWYLLRWQRKHGVKFPLATVTRD